MDVHLDFLLQQQWKLPTGFWSNHLVCQWKSAITKLVRNIIIPHLLLNKLQHLSKELVFSHWWCLQDGDFIWSLIVIIISQYQMRTATRYQKALQLFNNVLHWNMRNISKDKIIINQHSQVKSNFITGRPLALHDLDYICCINQLIGFLIYPSPQ